MITAIGLFQKLPGKDKFGLRIKYQSRTAAGKLSTSAINWQNASLTNAKLFSFFESYRNTLKICKLDNSL